jgi:hypothetical protein
MSRLGLEDYADLFESAGIKEEELSGLTDADLAKIGIDSRVDRKHVAGLLARGNASWLRFVVRALPLTVPGTLISGLALGPEDLGGWIFMWMLGVLSIPGVLLFGFAFSYVYSSLTTESSSTARKIIVAALAVFLVSLWFLLGGGGPFYQGS